MKHILTLLLITLTTLTSNAKTHIKPDNKTEAIIYGTDIPKNVQKWLKKELKNTTTSVLESFETPAFFTTKNAKIIGYIKGYDKTLGAKTGMFYYTNQLTDEDKPRVIEIHEDGRFELEIPLDYPMQNYFVIKEQVVNFYLEPGQNLSVILNWEDIKQSRRISYPLKNVTYQGVLGNINANLLYYKPNYSSRDFQKKEATMKPEAFKTYMLQFKTNALNKVKAYEQSREINKKTSELLKNDIILETYYSLFDYYSSGYYGQGERKENNIDDKMPDDYYDFIKDIPLKKQALLVSNTFSRFINRLEYAAPLNYREKINQSSKDDFFKNFVKFLEDKNVKISLEDKTLIKKENKSELENKKVTDLLRKYKSYITEYSKSNKEKQIKNHFVKEWKKRDSLASNLGIKDNLIYEIIKSRTLKFQLEHTNNKSWYWSELKKGIKSPHLLTLGDKLLENETSKPEFYELPNNEKGTAIFKKIIASYKGKIIVLGFWDPYSYYRGESLKHTKTRRNNYKNNKDIVFLFITNKHSSTLEEYNASIINNGFENSIRIPQDDYHYMRQLFKFNESARDILINKDGNVITNDFPEHNMEYIFKDKFNIDPDKK